MQSKKVPQRRNLSWRQAAHSLAPGACPHVLGDREIIPLENATMARKKKSLFSTFHSVLAKEVLGFQLHESRSYMEMTVTHEGLFYQPRSEEAGEALSQNAQHA